MAGVTRERVEVLPDGGDLVAVPDLVAHPQEDVLDLAADLRQQMQATAFDGRARNRDVETRLRSALVRQARQLGLARGHRLIELRADAVQEHPALPIPDAAQCLRELRLAAEVLHACIVELLR